MKQKDVLTKNNDFLNVMFRGTPCTLNVGIGAHKEICPGGSASIAPLNTRLYGNKATA